MQGISSSMMKLMNLNIQKMKRINMQGYDLNKLAPALFNEENSQYYNKMGFLVDWKVPFFEKTRKVLTREETLRRPTMGGKELKR